MKATYETVMDAAMQLGVADRCRIATTLWESTGDPVAESSPDELENILNQREAELDRDPSLEISHSDFMAHFERRRCS
jgi:hypothetical protein